MILGYYLLLLLLPLIIITYFLLLLIIIITNTKQKQTQIQTQKLINQRNTYTHTGIQKNTNKTHAKTKHNKH